MTIPRFGTDGIRGLVGSDITEHLLHQLGLCAAASLPPGATLAVGRDTRNSGPELHKAFCDGAVSGGVHVLDVGVLPSGILGWLCGFDASIDGGAIITASHNPEQYNGIKFYDSSGAKINRQTEQNLLSVWPGKAVSDRGTVRKSDPVAPQLTAALAACAGTGRPLSGLRLIVDCAHGAGAAVAGEIYRQLGAEVQLLYAGPGPINQDCGSAHPQKVAQAVSDTGADFGIALDGDGDRLVMIASDNTVLDGDDILFLHARLQQPAGLAGTVMTNMGLENALADMGIAFSRSDVGEVPLHTHMLERGWQLGGEPSGHLLNLQLHQSADGLINAFDLLHRLYADSRSLSGMLGGLVKYSQYAIDLPWRDTNALQDDAVQQCIARFRKELNIGGSGAVRRRLLVRMSGTEPLLRLMVETEEADFGRNLGDKLAGELAQLAPAAPGESARQQQAAQ